MATITLLPRRARAHIGPMGYDGKFRMSETFDRVWLCETVQHLYLSISWADLHRMFCWQGLWNNVEIPGTDLRLDQHIVENTIVNEKFEVKYIERILSRIHDKKSSRFQGRPGLQGRQQNAPDHPMNQAMVSYLVYEYEYRSYFPARNLWSRFMAAHFQFDRAKTNLWPRVGP